MMIIGTKTGKEFTVEDEGYELSNPVTGDTTHVFLTKDRIITIRDEDIEYWNEVRTDDYIDHLELLECGEVSNIHGVDVA